MEDETYQRMIIYIWKGKWHQRKKCNVAKKFGIKTGGFESILATLTYKCLLYQSDSGRIIGILDKNNM